MEIRKIKKSDLSNGFLETLGSLRDVKISLDQAKQILKRREDLEIETYVAVIDKAVVGTVSLIFEPKFLYKGVIAAHLEDLSVHANHQSLGIGGALIQHCINEAINRKCYKIILNCTKEMKKYYKKHGFKKTNLQLRYDLPLF